MANGHILRQITADLDKIAEQAGVTVAQARSEYLNRLSLEVVRGTPVKTGRLRASWFLSPTLTGSPGNPADEITQGAPGATLARLAGQSGALASLDGSVYLLNGANYAIFVEARTQFLRKVLARSRAIAAAVVTEIKNIKATGIP
jgi:hypothetical protein